MRNLEITNLQAQANVVTAPKAVKQEPTKTSLFEVKDKTVKELIKFKLYEGIAKSETLDDDKEFLFAKLKNSNNKRQQTLILEAYEKAGKLEEIETVQQQACLAKLRQIKNIEYAFVFGLPNKGEFSLPSLTLEKVEVLEGFINELNDRGFERYDMASVKLPLTHEESENKINVINKALELYYSNRVAARISMDIKTKEDYQFKSEIMDKLEKTGGSAYRMAKAQVVLYTNKMEDFEKNTYIMTEMIENKELSYSAITYIIGEIIQTSENMEKAEFNVDLVNKLAKYNLDADEIISIMKKTEGKEDAQEKLDKASKYQYYFWLSSEEKAKKICE